MSLKYTFQSILVESEPTCRQTNKIYPKDQVSVKEKFIYYIRKIRFIKNCQIQYVMQLYLYINFFLTLQLD